jgi:hypothetical protein
MPTPVSASIQSFSQDWLGQFSSDPTLDGYGNAVIAGARYYNNALNVIRIYSGTSWSAYNPGDASAAANSANLAAAYATQAGNAATQAAASAASAASSLASIGTAVTQAQASATAAASSATSASGSASTAASSATSAGTSATNAAASATSASTSATNAANSATNASSSAAGAATSASSAATNAGNASTSATNAANSASASATSATAAAGSATAAAGSASAAATSAGSAAGSASAAAASAALAASIVGGIIVIPLSNSNITLSSAQFANAIIVFTGNITANIVVTTPATSHVFIAANNTNGAFTVTLGMTGGSATVSVPQGKANSLFCDGTSGVYATSSVSGLQFSGTKTISSTGTATDSTFAGTRTVLATSGMTTTLPAGSTLQSGAAIYFDNQTSGTQTLQVNGSDPWDIGSPLTMQANDKFLISWDGTEWRTALYSNYLNPVFKNGVNVTSGNFTALSGSHISTNTSTGIGLQITGTGGVTPLKSIASVGGNLTVLSNSGSTILTLTDTGILTTPNLDNTIIGANTPVAATFTKVTINEPANGTTTLVINGASDTSGANIQLIGNGGTTPNKYIRAQSGNFQLMNSAYGAAILTVGDGGIVTLANNLTGDMSNGVLVNRVYLQSSTTNGNTTVGILPNGSSTTAGLATYNNSTPTNSASLLHQVTSSATIINSTVSGTGTLLPLTFQMNGVEEGRLSTAGRWLFNTTTDDGTSIVQINGQLHLVQAGAGGGIEFGDGTIQTTANGTTAPVSTVYSPATGSTQITTGGYTPGFIQVYQNGVRLVNGAGQDYTATDSVHINLTHASGQGDTYEVLTNVIYSPQTAMTPSEVLYTPAAGTTTFTVTTYTVGFVDVYLNGAKLVNNTDFTATTGNSVTLVGFTANGTDQFLVKVWSTYTPANALPLSGGTLTGSVTASSSGFTFSDGSTQLSAPMGRNRIINGNCNIAQRTSLVASTGIIGYGGPDRFNAQNANSAGGQFTQSQGTITYGGVTKNAVMQTVNTAVSNLTGTNFWYGITQLIEGFNCFDLLGQQAAISFIFNTNVTGTYSVSLRDATGNNSYVTTFAATSGTPVKVTLSVASIPTSLTTPNSTASGMALNIGALNTGTYQTSTLNAWQTNNVLCASTATNWGASINNFIAVTELQLEPGPTATPFERVNYSDMLIRCQRYYQTLTCYQQTYGAANGVQSLTYNYPVLMRTGPTVNIGSPTYSNGSGFSVTSVTAPTTSFLIGSFTVTALGQATVNANTTMSAEL